MFCDIFQFFFLNFIECKIFLISKHDVLISNWHKSYHQDDKHLDDGIRAEDAVASYITWVQSRSKYRIINYRLTVFSGFENTKYMQFNLENIQNC